MDRMEITMGKAIKKATSDNQTPKRKKHSVTIKTRIMLCFLIPVALIVVLGVVCYQKSSSNLTDAYEVATVQSLDAVCEYLSFGMDSVSSVESECLTYKSILDYVKMVSYTKTDPDYTNAHTDIKQYLTMKKATNKFIKDIILIPSAGFDLISTDAHSEVDGFFADLAADKSLNFKSLDGIWTRSHAQFDESLAKTQDDYLCSVYRKFPSARAAVFIDIDGAAVEETMSGLDFGEGSILGLVLPDGTEFYYGDTKPSQANFLSQISNYQQALASESTEGFSYYETNGTRYLFTYACTDNGFTLCALVPEDNIIGEVNSLGLLTVILVAIGAVLAVTAGILLSTNISKNIKVLTQQLDRVSDGDFTVEFDDSRTDEFGKLTGNVKGTIANIRELILHVADVTREVESCSDNVIEKSENLSQLASQVNESTSRVAGTVESEAMNAQRCVEEMDVLSQKIERTGDNIIDIRDFAIETSTAVTDNIEAMNILVEKSTHSAEIMSLLLDEIDRLKKQAESVNEFIEVIGGIASQTNLLSLNASIEAARAGESGRGFSVVAEEIRKLADQTSKAAAEIKKCANAINEQAVSTADNVHAADEIVKSQNEISNGLIENLTATKSEIDSLMGKINDITDDMRDMSGNRATTIDSISNISASTEETFSLTSLVSEVIESHDESSSELASVSRELRNKANALNEAVHRFKI